mmetsp:Transcript_33437/g.32492  ORF Transcript_33437/g.32492 Transcript_33437/m.32492 type:complete len:124 (-) Transcript_33437:47-418(-)
MNEAKVKKLEGKVGNVRKEMEKKDQELREERKKNMDLKNLVDKLQKKLEIKELEKLSKDEDELVGKVGDLEKQVKILTESFQKSEQIRHEQKNLIKKLREQLQSESESKQRVPQALEKKRKKV